MFIGLLPLDTRPVCYDFPYQLAAVAGWDLLLPPRSVLTTPNLKTPVDPSRLENWLNTIKPNMPSRWVLSNDMLTYGGLIPSRLHVENLSDLQHRIENLLYRFPDDRMVFSSILRIPNYNSAEEEPTYWSTWGQALYHYSITGDRGLLPSVVLDDFLTRRTTNFAVNKCLLNQLKQSQLKGLVFCQDDTGPVGLNVEEANRLKYQLSQMTEDGRYGMVQTGADELAVCLLTRLAISRPYRVWPLYSDPQGSRLLAPFDGVPFETVVHHKIALCGATLAANDIDADLIWLIHVPSEKAGDHMEGQSAVCHEGSYKTLRETLAAYPTKPVCLADVAYANGGDPCVTDWLLTQPAILQKLYGYAAWNTPGNALGSSLAMALTYLDAQHKDAVNRLAFEQLLVLRMLDDGVYQGQMRAALKAQHVNPLILDDAQYLTTAMQVPLRQMAEAFPWLNNTTLQFSWPCQRLFEIRIQTKTA